MIVPDEKRNASFLASSIIRVPRPGTARNVALATRAVRAVSAGQMVIRCWSTTNPWTPAKTDRRVHGG